MAALLQGLEWVELDDVRHWGIDSRTIDLAFTVLSAERDRDIIDREGERAQGRERRTKHEISLRGVHVLGVFVWGLGSIKTIVFQHKLNIQ